jgi:CBS domain-containing protein/heme-degrading monooxygenase HmoA
MKALVTARRVEAGDEEEFRRRWAGGAEPSGMVDALLLQDEEDPRETLSISLWENARDLLAYRTGELARQRREELADLVDKERWRRGYVAWSAAELPGQARRWWLIAIPLVVALSAAGIALFISRRKKAGIAQESETWTPMAGAAPDRQRRPSVVRSGGMLVRDLMTPDPRTVDVRTDAETASRLMHELNIGALPVLADGKLAGILTDRDLALGVGERKAPPSDLAAGDLMSAVPITVAPDASVEEAARLMSDHKIRRLPVTEGSRLVGIISLGDLADDGAERAAGAALEEISEPSTPRR